MHTNVKSDKIFWSLFSRIHGLLFCVCVVLKLWDLLWEKSRLKMRTNNYFCAIARLF